MALMITLIVTLLALGYVAIMRRTALRARHGTAIPRLLDFHSHRGPYLGLLILAPIFWLFVMSISPAADLTAKPLRWWPSEIDLSRYANC